MPAYIDESELVESSQNNMKLVFQLEDKPPFLTACMTAFQHFLAIFVSIMTAPLLVCLGLGLDASHTNFIISSSLLVSGIGTIIQVVGLGPIGSRLLSIQGTSFTFIGALILAGTSLLDRYETTEALGVLFGSAAAGGITVMLLSLYLEKLKTIITPTVTGVTVVLLGVALVIATWHNLDRSYNQLVDNQQATLPFFIMSIGVVSLILLLNSSKNNWFRLSSISIALGIGYIFALATGQIDFSLIASLPNFYVPEFAKFSIGFDWAVFLMLLPIYFVTVAESIGDITATSSLSNQPINNSSYWKRVRNGVMADGFNSLLASMMSSFPSTTFSQNNGVIRLTGVASRYIGIYVGALLILFSLFPILGGLFQVMPSALLFGALLLMFGLISVSGFQILQSVSSTRSWIIASISIVLAIVLSFLSHNISGLGSLATLLLESPIVLGIIFSIVLERVTPSFSTAVDIN